MNVSPNREYIKSVLLRLLQSPSPTGFCDGIMKVVEEEAGKLGYTVERTRKGNGVIRIPGRQAGRAIGISCHVDTLGAMVRSIKPNGWLRMTPIGGYMMGSIENEYCTVHTRSGRTIGGTILPTKPSVHVYSDARELKREESSMEIRLDEPVNNQKETEELGIRVGDFVSFDPRPQLLENGYIKSRHLDDKAGVAAVFGYLELQRRHTDGPVWPLTILFSTYEEVGHGSSSLPAGIDELIAVDMGAMGDDLSAKEQLVSICAKDSSGPYDYKMTSKLIALSEQNGIPYAVDIYPHYGSDASAALRGGHDIRAALIGPCVHASHGMERTHLDAIEGTSRLLAAYVAEPADDH